MKHHGVRRCRCVSVLVAVAVAALIGGCGGADDGAAGVGASTCSVADRQGWLHAYMDDWYFWYALAPRPDADDFAGVDDYFQALLYTGTDPRFPRDQWSRSEPTESFDRFYGDGSTLGYGVAVNGLEAVEQPGVGLVVRYVEPQSDAAVQGVRRGDGVVSVNGRSAAEIVAANDFAALTPAGPGELLRLVLRDAGGAERSVIVTAGVFKLTPVAGAAVYTTKGGRRLAYLTVKDMIGQAQAGLESAFALFRAQGAQDLVLDLRYNGGGLVDLGRTLASYIAGRRAAGQAYASLLYNDRRSAHNQRYDFTSPPGALDLSRVFVLTGQRTCSASEQVVNGLRGVGIQVIAVGDTTCGKPVGSLPRDDGCGTTYSVVNFESVNARNEGRWFDGFDATCQVDEDWSVPQGAAADPLVATAAWWADTGSCAPGAGQRKAPLAAHARARAARVLDERADMIPR